MNAAPSLRKNIVALYAVQLSTYAIPLITLPWLTRVLGADGFGRLNFCLAVNGYFILLADYGFNLSATRRIAMHSRDAAARASTFWNTISVKALLAAIAFPILLGLTYCSDKLSGDRSLLIVGYLSVVGTVLTPAWYFQGTERLATLSLITIFTRALSIPATFILVRSRGDVIMALSISAGVQLSAGIVALALLFREQALNPVQVSRLGMRQALQDGWHIFLSTASTSLYTTSNTVLLGFIAGDGAVGYYSAAEKLIGVSQTLLTPLSQSVYPRISRLMQESRAEAYALIRKVLRIQGLFGFAVSAALLVLAPYLIRLLFGPGFEQAAEVLRRLSPLPFLVGLSNVFGIQTMLALGMKRSFTRILVSAGAINLVLLFFLAQRSGAAGAAVAVLSTEALVTVLMGGILYHKRVPIFSRSAAE